VPRVEEQASVVLAVGCNNSAAAEAAVDYIHLPEGSRDSWTAEVWDQSVVVATGVQAVVGIAAVMVRAADSSGQEVALMGIYSAAEAEEAEESAVVGVAGFGMQLVREVAECIVFVGVDIASTAKLA